MKKRNLSFLGLLVILLALSLVFAGCPTGDNNDGGNNNNQQGNNNNGNNNNNNGNTNEDKTFTFRVKNEASGYTISRIRVGSTVNMTGLNISNGQYSSSITYTLTGGNSGFGNFNVNVHYDSAYPNIAAGISVEANWPASFDLRLWSDNGTYKLSRVQ